MRTPPHSLEMETAVLGSMLLTAGAVECALDGLTSLDFYDVNHREVFSAIARLYHDGKPIEPALVALESSRPQLDIYELAAGAPAALSIKAYVDVVAEKAALRRTITYAETLAGAAWNEDIPACDDLLNDPMSTVLNDRAPDTEPIEASKLAQSAGAKDWLVDGLFARLEVVLWVGEPGYGKSTLLRQIGVRCASAIHPFTGATMKRALRVLIVDCQESESDAGMAIAPLLKLAGDNYQGTLWVESRPQGIDLTAPRWQRWLDKRVAWVEADLVILGPLYNAVRGAPGRGKQSEETAELAASALGDLVVRRNCALMVEAHAPHGDEMRVRGSKLWEDWPAFGFGLVPDKNSTMRSRSVDVVKFRGDRYADRTWPVRFVQGTPWPWEAKWSKEPV